MTPRVPSPADAALKEARRTWDAVAATFDEEADHGLRDPKVRTAWADLLRGALGPEPLRVVDLGCGTGSLSLLLHDLGHVVTGLDCSPEMLELARRKTGPAVTFIEGDASHPALPAGAFDAVICRHVIWALPDPRGALGRWAGLLGPGGRLLAVEGNWHTGAGLAAAELRALLPAGLLWTGTTPLSGEPDLWGGPVQDERYLLTAALA